MTKEELCAHGATLFGQDGAEPTEVDLGDGRYRYTFTIPGGDGIFVVDTTANSGGVEIEQWPAAL